MKCSYEDKDVSSAAKLLDPSGEGVAGALVLGSGLSSALSDLPTIRELSFSELPGLGASKVPGHAGRVRIAGYEGHPLLLFEGRPHFYEDGDMRRAGYPARLASAMNAPFIVLCSAVGGVTNEAATGSWVFVDDHINLMGKNPLLGVSTDGGPPFVDLAGTYRKELFEELCSRVSGLNLLRGVLAAFSGPTYETPAEVKMSALAGASIVGMSIVPEAVWATFLGVDVVAFGRVVNPAAGLSESRLNHEDVVREGAMAATEAVALIGATLDSLLNKM
ncbi:MAG: purine-nucleoside phosphorylase [Deltaproteobacteria bacterium]|nr:MAG: purine-nucleoside phosphorylase [Deltaproteobacteria bacterium]